jgi:tRNA A-37 threonylcarbamoyl transferase component Bud32
MDRIGQYKIVRQVGMGAFASVYEAFDELLGRRLAVKVAKTHPDSLDFETPAVRFQTEARVLRRLDHPSIARVFDTGVMDDGTPFLVMEWIEGRSLEQILQDGQRIPLDESLSIAEQAASALGAAHEAGFVHSDVKPSNIFIDDASSKHSPRVKLSDFGLAGALSSATSMTKAGTVIGTPYYMAPEQIRGQALSPSSDVWQLGVVLFRMLTGLLPFRGDGLGVVQAIVSAHVEIPEGANLPPSVEAFLRRCLDKDPLKRPLNGTEAAGELARLRTTLRSFTAGITRLIAASAAPFPVAPSAAAPFAAPHPAPPRAAPPLAARPPAAPTRSLAKRQSPEPTHRANVPLAGQMPISSNVVLTSAAVVVLATVVLLLSRYTRFQPGPWIGVVLGVGLALGGAILGRAIQNLLAARRRTIAFEAQDILTGARAKKRLSQTLAIQVGQLLDKCRMADEKFLAMSMAVMVEEFRSAAAFDDRQKALMNAVTLLDKLMTKLSPWYVRHDKLIGFIVTLVGILSGLAAVAENLAKLVKGS